MSVAARVADEMSVKLGYQVSKRKHSTGRELNPCRSRVCPVNLGGLHHTVRGLYVGAYRHQVHDRRHVVQRVSVGTRLADVQRDYHRRSPRAHASHGHSVRFGEGRNTVQAGFEIDNIQRHVGRAKVFRIFRQRAHFPDTR